GRRFRVAVALFCSSPPGSSRRGPVSAKSPSLEPSLVQCRTTLDSMAKLVGALDSRWYENLRHPISADTCDAQFRRAPERHPGTFRYKWLLTGQLLFQVRIRPEKSPSRPRRHLGVQRPNADVQPLAPPKSASRPRTPYLGSSNA